MNQQLNDITKKTAEAIIDMSARLADKMEAWHDIVVGEGSLRNTERAGFVNKTSADAGIDMVVDVQAPDNSNEATLRTWAIESTSDEGWTKLVNNIQLMFATTYGKARSLTERFDTVTRDDIRALLQDNDTNIKAVVISNQSGLDKAAAKIHGKHYDLTVKEIDEQGIADEISGELNTVLDSLRRDAAMEANS